MAKVKSYTRLYSKGRHIYTFTASAPSRTQRMKSTGAYAAWRSMKPFERKAMARGWTAPDGTRLSSLGKFRTGQATYRTLRGRYGRTDLAASVGRKMAKVAAMSVVDYALDPPRSGSRSTKPVSFRVGAKRFAKGLGQAALMGAAAYATRRAVRGSVGLARRGIGAFSKGHPFFGNQYVQFTTSRFAGRRRGAKRFGQRAIVPKFGTRASREGIRGNYKMVRPGVFRRRG